MNINLSDSTVEREAIIGFVVLKNAKEGQIICSPLTFNEDGFSMIDWAFFEENPQIIGIIPAPPNSYKVYVCSPNGKCIDIGFEINGKKNNKYWIRQKISNREDDDNSKRKEINNDI